MVCIICEGNTGVINSRTASKPGDGHRGLFKVLAMAKDKNIIWRVRQCKDCGERFETVETQLLSFINLIKQDATIRGRHEF